MKKVLCLVLLFALCADAFAQNRQRSLKVPKGEKMKKIGKFARPQGPPPTLDLGFRVTHKDLFHYGSTAFSAPPGTEIRTVQKKLSPYAPGKFYLLVLLTDNVTYQVEVKGNNSYDVKKLGIIPMAQYESGRVFIGDDLYVMSDEAVYISSDTPNHQIWAIDTAGLNVNGMFNFCRDMDIDTTQKVWLATANGIYSQLLGSTQWVHEAAYNGGAVGPTKIFVDGMQRIWVAQYSNVSVSSDGGASFQTAPSGLNGFVTDFGDDAFGNIYIITGDDEVYYSPGGTQPFTRIDMPIAGNFAHFGASTPRYNDITGDTLIYLSTEGGGYMSADQGATWTNTSDELANKAYSVAATADHRLLMTTSLGLYRKESAGNWSKLHPSGDTALSEMMVFTDNTGTIYHTGEVAYSNSSAGNFLLVRKSTDNGDSFVPDTAGAGALGVVMNPFFVDETGVQHAAAVPFVSGVGPKPMVWKKEPGQPWATDTAGLSFVTNLNAMASFRCFGSDNAGNVYVVVINNNDNMNYVFKRAVGGGSWSAAGTLGGIVIEITGRSGKLVAATSNGVYYYNAGSWSLVPAPSTLSNPQAWTVAVAPSGIVWAYFEEFDVTNFLSLGKGIWYTTDMTTWHYPQPNVDTALFAKLIPVGDSLFALDGNWEGIYVFDTSTILSVNPSETPLEDQQVVVVPNPFTDQTSFKVMLTAPAMVSGTIYDIRGAIVSEIPAHHRQAGSQYISTSFRQDLPPGMYIYTLRVNEKVFRGKLLKQ